MKFNFEEKESLEYPTKNNSRQIYGIGRKQLDSELEHGIKWLINNNTINKKKFHVRLTFYLFFSKSRFLF